MEKVVMKGKRETITFELEGQFGTLDVLKSRIESDCVNLEIEDITKPKKFSVLTGKTPPHEAWLSVTCTKNTYDAVIKKISEYLDDMSEKIEFTCS